MKAGVLYGLRILTSGARVRSPNGGEQGRKAISAALPESSGPPAGQADHDHDDQDQQEGLNKKLIGRPAACAIRVIAHHPQKSREPPARCSERSDKEDR